MLQYTFFGDPHNRKALWVRLAPNAGTKTPVDGFINSSPKNRINLWKSNMVFALCYRIIYCPRCKTSRASLCFLDQKIITNEKEFDRYPYLVLATVSGGIPVPPVSQAKYYPLQSWGKDRGWCALAKYVRPNEVIDKKMPISKNWLVSRIGSCLQDFFVPIEKDLSQPPLLPLWESAKFCPACRKED